MTRLRLALVALLVALSACAGPETPLGVDVGSVPTDILLGQKVKQVAQAPLPPSVLTPKVVEGVPRPLLPMEVAPPSSTTPPTKRPPSPACPDADPLKAPALVADPDVQGTPAEATYIYRLAGTFEIGGPNAQSGSLPASSTRTVKNITRPVAGNYFEYDVAADVSGSVTTSRYRVVPAKGNQPNPSTTPTTQLNPPYPQTPTIGTGTPANPGIYLVSIDDGGAAAPVVFNGGNGMLLAKLPFQPHDTFQSTATAGTVTENYTSVIGQVVEDQYRPKARVNACGIPLDSWTVRLFGEITQGSDSPRLEFESVYQFAPQFGGISLEDRVQVKSPEDAGTPVFRQSHAIINSVPEASS